ncbi:MAG TPA: class I SAM-dependent methyltransferase [Candidatus Saccharicenans sp.]|nr:class I SAM-dependent methyltransferase [Candidatus Saccharicenans sp.]
MGKRETATEKQPILSEISRRRKLKLLLKYLKPESYILEVGAGDGWFSSQLKQHGHRAVTLDLRGPADIVGDIMDWQVLGLDSESFDAVIALEVIEHVDCLEALCNLCKKDGLIMLSSPHPRWDWLLKILENLGLTQKRTSKHSNLTDFNKIKLEPAVLSRPLYIHQVAIFRNKKMNDY